MQSEPLIANRFELGEFIAQGGMGAVYKGHDRQTGEPVAIKLLKSELVTEDPTILQRFIREGETLRALNHPNIVKLLDAVEQDGQHYLIMEYVVGGSLAELLHRERQLDIPRVVTVALELADALTRAHHLKIIHRDLKPANILLADDGTLRLTDFGVALTSGTRMTKEGVLVGTYSYLAPEAFQKQTLDARTDLWALGVMMFEMLAGYHPFKAKSMNALIGSILTASVPDLEVIRPDAPTALIDLVYRLLEKDRDLRIPSARQVAAELEKIIHECMPEDAEGIVRHITTHSTGNIAPEVPVRHNLPAQTTEFVGREMELRELIKLLDSTRLVTILGPGGMGKTRLTLEAAAKQLQKFKDGVYFVSLAPLTVPDTIIPAIAETMQFVFHGTEEPKHLLLSYLQSRQVLLILDNFEHILSGVTLVSEILQAAPQVKILATSRTRLGLQEETLFRLDGMDFPDWETPEDALEYSAVKLFMQCAKRIQPHFALNAEDLMYLARICRQMEGLPLGILIAAGWVDTLSLQEISMEIERNLDFLESEQQNLPTRQRSIRAVFDYSWKLLSQEEREVFPKFTVFRGGFTRDAAEKVTGASLRVLASLVNKSMLRRHPDTGRYEIHELLRQYATEKLEEVGQLDIIQNLHSAYYADFMDERWVDLKGRRQVAALKEIEVEVNNLRAAWFFLANHRRTRRMMNYASALWMFFDLRGQHKEAKDLFAHGIQPPASKHDELLNGHLMALQGWHTNGLGDPEAGKKLAQQGIALLEQHDNSEALLIALQCLGICFHALRDVKNARDAAEQCIQLAHERDDRWAYVRGLYWLGITLLEEAEPAREEIRQIAEMAVEMAHEINDVWMIACISCLLFTPVLLELKEYSEADRYARQGLKAFESIGQLWGMSMSYLLLGKINEQTNNPADADKFIKRGLKTRKEAGTPSGDFGDYLI